MKNKFDTTENQRIVTTSNSEAVTQSSYQVK